MKPTRQKDRIRCQCQHIWPGDGVRVARPRSRRREEAESPVRLGTSAATGFAGIPKAVLKPPHSRRWREPLAALDFAKRLDCGAFTAAFPPNEPRSSRREEAHTISGEGNQSLLTSAATVQRLKARNTASAKYFHEPGCPLTPSDSAELVAGLSPDGGEGALKKFERRSRESEAPGQGTRPTACRPGALTGRPSYRDVHGEGEGDSGFKGTRREHFPGNLSMNRTERRHVAGLNRGEKSGASASSAGPRPATAVAVSRLQVGAPAAAPDAPRVEDNPRSMPTFRVAPVARREPAGRGSVCRPAGNLSFLGI